jgi:ATP-binding cassette subfamily B multidrug efflux pump
MFAYFEKLINPYPSKEMETPPNELWPFIWFYARDVKHILLLMVMISAIFAVIEIIAVGYVGTLINHMATMAPEQFYQDQIQGVIWIGVALLLVLPALEILSTLLLHQSFIGNFPMRLRWLMHRYLLGQSYQFFQNEFAGRIATKMMQGAMSVREVCFKACDIFAYVVVYIVSAFALVASFDVWFLAPMVIWFVGYSCTLWYFLPKLKSISQQQADARSLMTGRVVDSYTNISSVKLFAHAGNEEAYAKESMDEFLQTVYPQMRLVSLLHILLNLLNGILMFGSILVGVLLMVSGSEALGGLAVAIGLVTRLQSMSHWVMWEMAGLFENIGMAHDSMQMLARPRDVLDAKNAKLLAVKNSKICFDRVKFHYGKDRGILEDFSLTINAGEKIGLIGPSGAGKTTLMNLMLRLYDVEGGQITIDEQDISKITQDSLRSKIGVVSQDTSLLHRSVFENIAYGNPRASQEDVMKAAQRANAHEFIETLEDPKGRKGYEAHVGERGITLSGGQRQRIAIARLFLKDAPILVLDEATSALDSEVEAAIQENLDELMKDKTAMVIAHRLSTIAALDRLVVLEGGKIVEEGSHDELSKADGTYARLWSRQSGGFLDL